MKRILFSLLAVCMAGALNAQILFSESFDGASGFATQGWTVINNDGLTPATNVAYVTDAWIIREDFITTATDSIAVSTSWYAPAGVSDDWMITPAINLTGAATLDWDAMAPDAAYADGYEVWVSTVAPTVAGMTAGTMVFTVADEATAWTSQSVNLAAFAGQTVYIGWRNNSNDEFLLFVDDIVVQLPPAVDAEMSLAAGEEYTLVPLEQVVSPIATTGTITNVGGSTVTNVTMTVNVLDGAMTNVYTATSTAVPSLTAGSNTVHTVAGYTPTVPDLYTVQLICNVNEVDPNLLNDTVTYTYIVTDSTYARDMGTVDVILGVGAGTTGTLGNNYEIFTPTTMTSVSFFIAPGAPALADTIKVSVYSLAAGIPTTMIGESGEYILTTADTVAAGVLLTLAVDNMAGNPLDLTAGTYFVGVEEYETVDNMALGQSLEINTPNTCFGSIAGGAFAPIESFGFPGPFIVRPNFACAATSATVTETACLTYLWPLDGNTYTATGQYMTTIANAAGCDSVVTLDLTISTPDVVTAPASSCTDYTWAANGTTYTMSGQYTEVLMNAGGCDSTVTLDLTIGGVDITTTTVGATISSNAGGSATYQWVDCDNGSTPIAGATNQSYTATVSGNYAVIIVDGTCNGTSACEPVCVPTASGAAETACNDYTWALDGNTYSATGMYTAVLTNAAGCDSTVTLDLTINTVDNTATTAGNTITANLAGATYVWIDCATNMPIAGETGQSFTPASAGDYAVIVSDGTCSDTSACLTSTVGLDEAVFAQGVNIFPNPSEGSFTIELLDLSTDMLAIEFVDANGRVIASETMFNVAGDLSVPMHVENVEAGVYFVRISSQNMQMVERVIIMKK